MNESSIDDEKPSYNQQTIDYLAKRFSEFNPQQPEISSAKEIGFTFVALNDDGNLCLYKDIYLSEACPEGAAMAGLVAMQFRELMSEAGFELGAPGGGFGELSSETEYFNFAWRKKIQPENLDEEFDRVAKIADRVNQCLDAIHFLLHGK